MSDFAKTILKRILIILGWLLAWQLLSLWVNNRILLVGPVTTLLALGQRLVTLSFWKTIGFSFLRIAAGFSAGCVIGFLTAALAVRLPLLEDILSPFITLLKAVPVAAFVVLFLIWWHSNVLSIAVTFCVVLPQIYVSTLEGIHSADPELLEMAKVLHIPFFNRCFYIYRPSLKPYLDASIRTAVGMSWKSGVAAEVIGTPAFSIGEGLYLSKISLDTAGILCWSFVIIVLSIVCEHLLLRLWNTFGRWQPKCRPVRDPGRRPSGSPFLLRLSHLNKSYQSRPVLTDFSADYPAGTIRFTWPSGGGKTTLFRLIAGLEAPDSGTIDLCGSRLTMLFQENRLCMDCDALTNIALVTGDRQKAGTYLEDLLPREDWEKPCQSLSGGMRRRVALARAFAKPADLVILDEPFTGLDAENRRRVASYIEKYSGDRLILIATHI